MKFIECTQIYCDREMQIVKFQRKWPPVVEPS